MTGQDAGQRLRLARAARDAASTQAARGQTLHDLSLAAYLAYVETGRLDLMDEAVAAAEAGLRATPSADAETYSDRANDFGWLLRQRYDDRGDEGDLWRAVSALRTAVRRTPDEHREWPGRTMNLANALTELYERIDASQLLDEAMALLEEAVRRSPPNTPDHGSLLSALSRTLRVRYGGVGSREDLERSVQLDGLALATIPPRHPDRVALLGNAANGLSHLSTSRDASWRQALALWREAYELAGVSGLAQKNMRFRW